MCVQYLYVRTQMFRLYVYCHIHLVRHTKFKEGLYRIWCRVNRLGDSGVHTFGDTSAFVNPAGQLLCTRRGKTRMDGVGIVFEFYIAPLQITHTTHLS